MQMLSREEGHFPLDDKIITGQPVPKVVLVPYPYTSFVLDRPAALSHYRAFSVSISNTGAHIKIEFPLSKSLNIGTTSTALNSAF